jgi:predicted amidohydrolase YtcJ
VRRRVSTPMVQSIAALLAALLGIGAGGCLKDRDQRRLQRETPDLILVGGVVHTMDPLHPLADAVGIVGDRISYVGERAGIEGRIGDQTRVLDVDGQTVIPGMMDTQIHFVELGRRAEIVDLVGTTSIDDIRARLSTACAAVEPGRWVHGRGWDQNDWAAPRFPTVTDLEGVCEANPVCLDRICRHVYWVNRTALARAGVTAATGDPAGGRIGHLEAGEPDGLFFDDAQDLVDQVIPGASVEDLERWVPIAQQRCLELGLTSVGDSGTTQKRLTAYETAAQAGKLDVRIYVMIEDDPAEVAAVMQQGPRTGLYDHHLTIRTIKENVDGTMGARGAAMLEPYSDDPDNLGTLIIEYDDLLEVTVRALERGFQMDTHAIGDRATRLVLDAYEEALRKHPTRDHRFRIEHAQRVHPDDIPRFERLGVIPMMQPTQATSDMPWVGQRLGPERLETAYAWRTMVDSGARVGFGSDYPVESANPLWGIHAATTRQDHDGQPDGGWYPEQRITAAEALRAYTLDAAHACFEEDLRGSLEVGKLADLVVLDRDILVVRPQELLETQVLLTIVGGKVVFEQAVETADQVP